jgi:hypothetical protein
MVQMEIVDPRGILRIADRPLAARGRPLAGTRIGFLSNKKANATLLLAEVEAILRQRLGDFEAVRGEKGAAVPAPPELVAELSRCSAVLTAMADCGSCTSWSLHDAVFFEDKGIPSVLLCSDEFAPLARAESVAKGMSGLPLAVVPHPVADNSAQEIHVKAQSIADEVVAILTRPADELARAYKPLYHRLAETRLSRRAACLDDACVVDPSGGKSAA